MQDRAQRGSASRVSKPDVARAASILNGMPLIEFEGKSPQVHPGAFIAPTATLVGDVVVEEGASIWYGAVLRADDCRIVVRANANVQDNSVIHGRPDEVVEIGPGATVAHSCVVHSATLGRHALVGNASTVLDGASIGEGAMLAAGSVLNNVAHVGDGMLAAGAPATERKPVKETAGAFFVELNPTYYADLGQRHRTSVRIIKG